MGRGLTVPVDQSLAAAGLRIALPLLPARTVHLHCSSCSHSLLPRGQVLTAALERGGLAPEG